MTWADKLMTEIMHYTLSHQLDELKQITERIRLLNYWAEHYETMRDEIQIEVLETLQLYFPNTDSWKETRSRVSQELEKKEPRYKHRIWCDTVPIFESWYFGLFEIRRFFI
jgi:hypothetical protein